MIRGIEGGVEAHVAGDPAREVLSNLWEHHWWSLERFLPEIESLSEEEFKRNLGISYSSVHGAVAHLLGAEIVWLARIRGESMTLVPGVLELATRTLIRDSWRRCRDGWKSVLYENDLQRIISYRNTSGKTFSDPIWRIMTHLVDHGATYLGVVMSGLRLLGATPPASGVIMHRRLASE